MRTVLAAACCAALGTPAPAREFVVVPGPLSDPDFLRAVSCGAPPGAPCLRAPLRWADARAADLSVELIAPEGFDSAPVVLALAAAARGLSEAAPGVALRLAAPGEAGDIRLHAAAGRAGGRVEGTGGPLDGLPLAAAYVLIEPGPEGIERAHIALATDIGSWDLGPVLLEEMTQALGFPYDLRAEAYEGVSVFSEDSNAATELGPQDARVLALAYPGR